MFFWEKPKFNITTLDPGTPGPEHPPLAQPAAPLAAPQVAAFVAPPDVIRPAEKPRRRVAFVVFHGMGQQVPYETQSMLAECMLEKESRESKILSD